MQAIIDSVAGEGSLAVVITTVDKKASKIVAKPPMRPPIVDVTPPSELPAEYTATTGFPSCLGPENFIVLEMSIPTEAGVLSDVPASQILSFAIKKQVPGLPRLTKQYVMTSTGIATLRRLSDPMAVYVASILGPDLLPGAAGPCLAPVITSTDEPECMDIVCEHNKKDAEATSAYIPAVKATNLTTLVGRDCIGIDVITDLHSICKVAPEDDNALACLRDAAHNMGNPVAIAGRLQPVIVDRLNVALAGNQSSLPCVNAFDTMAHETTSTTDSHKRGHEPKRPRRLQKKSAATVAPPTEGAVDDAPTRMISDD